MGFSGGNHTPHSIDILNGKRVCPLPAAAAGLRVYRIKGNLPSAGAGSGRHYGIHTERIFNHNGPGRNFGTDRPITKEERRERDQSTPLMQTFLQDLVWLKDTCERYLQYLRFAGQNTLVMGCYQYVEYNSPYVVVPDLDDPRVPWCMRSMMAHVMDLNGVDFFAGLEFSQFQDVRNYVNDAQVARGADTYNLVNAEGEQRYASEIFTHVPNWLHPEIRSRFDDLVRDMTRTFGHLSCFRGVHQLFGPSQWGSGSPAFTA